MLHLVRLILFLALTLRATAQTCPRPLPPPGGFALTTDAVVAVTYSDGYQTFGSLQRPAGQAPSCGWPLVVFVHPLGATRASDLGLQLWIAGQGFAVWSYDVRGQGQAVAANLTHAHPGTTLWGPVERHDLAEQIQFVAAQPAWSGLVDATRCAVLGSSQGGAHAWNAAAFSGQLLTTPGRTPVVFPTIAAAVATDYIAETRDSWLRDGSLWNSWLIEAISGSMGGFELDAGLRQAVRSSFLAQDPTTLLGVFAAEGRDILPYLQQSTVPVLFAQAYHDRIDSPQLGLKALESMPSPASRAVLTTGGPHNAVANQREREARDVLILRWLLRWLWGEQNEVDLEAPYVLAELPLDPQQRDDTTYPWNRHHRTAPLQPASVERLWLHSGGSLQSQPPPATQPVATIQQTIDPTANFTPQSYLDLPGARDLGAVLAACPLDELVYSGTIAEERELSASATVSLHLVPQSADWMVAILLTIEPPGGSEVMLTSGCAHDTASLPGTPVEETVALPPVAVRIPAGSTVRLRLRNLWLREAPMERLLEVAPRFTDFQVDIEHGPSGTGSWLDLPLEPIRPRLVTPTTFYDLANPPVLDLRIRGGVVRAGLPYYLTFGISGHLPATPFHNDIMPVESDWLVGVVTTSWLQPEFTHFMHFLDGAGEATATLDFGPLAPLPLEFSGNRLTFAAFVFDDASGLTGAASNPCDVFLH